MYINIYAYNKHICMYMHMYRWQVEGEGLRLFAVSLEASGALSRGKKRLAAWADDTNDGTAMKKSKCAAGIRALSGERRKRRRVALFDDEETRRGCSKLKLRSEGSC